MNTWYPPRYGSTWHCQIPLGKHIPRLDCLNNLKNMWEDIAWFANTPSDEKMLKRCSWKSAVYPSLTQTFLNAPRVVGKQPMRKSVSSVLSVSPSTNGKIEPSGFKRFRTTFTIHSTITCLFCIQTSDISTSSLSKMRHSLRIASKKRLEFPAFARKDSHRWTKVAATSSRWETCAALRSGL